MKPTERLLNRSFVLLWQGQFASQIGNQLHATAMMFWVKHATDSASLMGLMLMLSMLPGVILGPLGGTIADRYSRRRIIVLSDLACGVAVLLLAGLLFLAPGARGVTVAWLFATSVLIGAVGAFFRPAISASIPDLVPPSRIEAANSIAQSSYQISVFAGQGLGGTLFRLLGAPVLFLANGVSYLFSAFLATFIRIPQRLPHAERRSSEILRAFLAETAEGFRFVWGRRGLRNLFLAAAMLNFFTAPFGVLLPFYVEDHLHAPTDWFGFILASLGVGALLGYGIAGLARARGAARGTMLIAALVLTGLALGALGAVHAPLPALGLTLVVGLLTGLINIQLTAILQRTTPTEIRGRVFGLLGTLSMGLMPIGMGLAGVAADAVGRRVAPIFMACGAAVAAVTLLVALDRDFRQYLSHEGTAPRET
jgi:MFS family permease